MAVGLTGCVATVQVASAPTPINAAILAQAHIVAAYDLFDPSSAQFRGDKMYRLSNDEYVVCGEMNGKNQLGGYVGFTPYYVRLGWTGKHATKKLLQIGLLASAGCRKAADGILNVTSG